MKQIAESIVKVTARRDTDTTSSEVPGNIETEFLVHFDPSLK